MLFIVVAAIPLVIWIYLLAFRGGFWRITNHLCPIGNPELLNKRLAVVIAARNEAPYIGRAITSLLDQDFPAALHIFLVDDASTDGTAELALAATERSGKSDLLTVIRGQPLQPGWTGKLWALSQGVARAEALPPDYLLLTDADILHGAKSVAQLVAVAETNDYDLASYMVKLACKSLAEKALIPAFVFFFLKLYPPAWIRYKTSRTAAAAGGCMLIRAAALQKIGGLAAIKNHIIDDCALARKVKRSGGRVWMGLTATTESMRSYSSFCEIGRMISRTAFNQLDHSPLLLVGTVAGLALTYVLPLILLLTGRLTMILFGLAAWILMSAAYLPMIRFYALRTTWCLTLPFVACFYTGATIHSAVQYWRGRGGPWKGRLQDMRS